MTANIDKLFDQLYPICRSITGDGIRESLKIISKHLPIKIYSIKSGTKVFDWVVPKEWKLNRAILKDLNNKTIIDTKDSNLHVLNFSYPFKGTIHFKELKKHLHTKKDLPNAIPYVTSYYKKNWGLCMSHNQFLKLKNKKYKVFIDTEIKNGFLNYGSFELKGESKKIFLITSYLCHPSMANNELSGPLTMIKIYEKLKKLRKRKYTYRFLLIPETIGSITYLHKQGKEISKKIVGGIVLTCLGGPNTKISFKLSRHSWLNQDSKIDKLAKHLSTFESKNYSSRDFSPLGGSDERQFCSPGYNLPVIQAAKTVYPPFGKFKEYHTSLDNKNFMKIQSIEKSTEQLYIFLEVFELLAKNVNGKMKYGEPQLGKRGLYPTLNSPHTRKSSNNTKTDNRKQLNIILSILSLADDKMDIIDIANFLKISVLKLISIVNLLIEKKLIEKI